MEVIKSLLTLHKSGLVLLVGTSSHGPIAEYIHEHVNSDRCINFRHNTSTLAELMELFLLSDLLISNDFGSPHFASNDSAQMSRSLWTRNALHVRTTRQ